MLLKCHAKENKITECAPVKESLWAELDLVCHKPAEVHYM